MKIDYQLVVDVETLLPKIEGLEENCHIIQSQLKWYQRACDGTDTPNATAQMYREWLTKSVAKAKRILAEQSIL